jgi:hypothetical protein
VKMLSSSREIAVRIENAQWLSKHSGASLGMFWCIGYVVAETYTVLLEPSAFLRIVRP